MVISFYSYKGGVGRSQLLVNVAACLCYEHEKKVLLIDWDLEAPGLPFFFKKNKEVHKNGLIDLFTYYLEFIKGIKNDELPTFDESYIQSIYKGNSQNNSEHCIDLISAGNENGYFNKIHGFNWESFYTIYDGKKYIEWLKENLLKKYDYIIIDSRTGISDYSGIANIQFPDVNVFVVAPTNQNFSGAFQVANYIKESDYIKKGYRKGLILPILSRIDPFIQEKVNYWSSEFKETFKPFLNDIFNFIKKPAPFIDHFINSSFIEYNSELSFGENVLFPIKRREGPIDTFTDKIRVITKTLLDIDKKLSQKETLDDQVEISSSQIIIDGNISINEKAYNIEDNFKSGVLIFLKIEKTKERIFNANLYLKSKQSQHDSLSISGENWCKNIELVIPKELIKIIDKIESIRRQLNFQYPDIDNNQSQYPLTILENKLSSLIIESFLSEKIGEIIFNFIKLLKENRIDELLIAISSKDSLVKKIPFEITLPTLFSDDVEKNRKLKIGNFGLFRTQVESAKAFELNIDYTQAAPLKMLFLTALPENLDERGKLLQIEEEQTRLIQSIGALEATGDNKPKIVIEFLDIASLAELDQALSARHHDIVHVSGQRAYHEAEKKGVLYFENEDGDEEQISGSALGETLRRHACVKLLILSACETATTGGEGGVTEQVAAYDIPGIIAMRFAVTDEGAKVFTTEFYTKLASGLSLTRSLAYAREKLHQTVQRQREQLPQYPHVAEWFTPVIYQNQAMGTLIDQNAAYQLPDNFYPRSSFLKTRHSRLIGEGFIGRKRYRIQLLRAFRAGKHVCLHGLGGLGKTTLAEAFAHNYENKSYATIIFRNGNQINEAYILDALCKRAEKANPDIGAQLREAIDSPDLGVHEKLQLLIDNYLRNRKTILIFDNAEDIQTDEGGERQREIGSANLSAFLQHFCANTPPNCHLLFTTRYKLTDLEDLIEHHALDKMGYAEQYRLINYSEVLRGIPLQERDEVYKRLDGLPRGYEYLEALLKKDKTFALSQVSQAEADVFANLLLAEVYDRLTEEEKTVFQLAAVFFSRTPLAALAAVSERNEEELLSILKSLRDWSLCFLEEDGRFEVQRLTREWVLKELVHGEQLKEIAFSAAQHFHSQFTLGDRISAKNYYKLAEAWEKFAETSFIIQDHYQLISLYPQAFELNTAVLERDIDAKTNGKALNYNGMMLQSVGQYDKALEYFERSLEIIRQIGENEGAVLNNISQIHQAKGDYDTALRYLEQSLEISQQIGDRASEGTTLNNLAAIAHTKGDYDTALRYLEQSLEIQQQVGDQSGEGMTLNNISQIHDIKGDYDTALQFPEQSLEIRKKIGDQKEEGTTLKNISQIYQAKGDYDTALLYLQQSLEIGQKIGNRKGEGIALNNISQIHRAKGDYDTALRYLEQSLEINQQIGDRAGEGTTLNNISQIHHAKGDYDTALRFLDQSLEIQQQIGDIFGMATTLHNMGTIPFENNEYERAVPYFIQAYQIFTKIGSPNAKVTEGYLAAIIEKIGEARFKEILARLNEGGGDG